MREPGSGPVLGDRGCVEGGISIEGWLGIVRVQAGWETTRIEKRKSMGSQRSKKVVKIGEDFQRERERSTMWVIWAHVEPSHPLQNDSGWKWRNSVIWKESLTILTWHLVLVHKTAVEERLLISSILRTMETTMGRNIYKYGKWKDLNKHYDVLLKLEKPACIYSFSYK